MAKAKKTKIEVSAPEIPAVKEEINNTEENLLEDNEGQLVVDVFENESDFVVMAAVAGISSKDVEIQIDKDMLVIKGCRSNPDIDKNKNYFYQECHWGPFSRRVVLPADVDENQIQAEFDKGILIVKVPKIKEKGRKDISVKEG